MLVLDKLLRLNHLVSLDSPIILKNTEYTKSEGSIYHMHYETELAVLLSGCITRVFNDRQFDCLPGDIWFTGIWEPHGYIVKKEPCSSIVFITAPEFLTNLRFPEEQTFNALAPYMKPVEQRPAVTNDNRKKIYEIAMKAKNLCENNIQNKNLWKRIIFLELLLSICTENNHLIRAANHSNSDFNVIDNAINTVFTTRDFIPVEEISSECGMNRCSFSKLFKRVMGIGFARFALRFRLSGVANELLTTNMPIKMLTYRWGFSDISHMHRLFKKHYGCSPTEYRKQISK